MYRDTLEYMRLFLLIMNLIFPTRYDIQYLESIPAAPEPVHADIYSLYDYHSTKGKKLIYEIKSKRELLCEYNLAQKMQQYLQDFLAEQQQFSFFLEPLVVPIPLHTQKIKIRGHNQSAGIARFLAGNINGRYTPHYLVKNKITQKQALLSSKKARIANVRNCFHVPSQYRGKIKNRDIIIIDDLVTTGATIHSAKETLLKHGARNIIAITVAH